MVGRRAFLGALLLAPLGLIRKSYRLVQGDLVRLVGHRHLYAVVEVRGSRILVVSPYGTTSTVDRADVVALNELRKR